jgi:hypothetical protein
MSRQSELCVRPNTTFRNKLIPSFRSFLLKKSSPNFLKLFCGLLGGIYSLKLSMPNWMVITQVPELPILWISFPGSRRPIWAWVILKDISAPE